MINGSRRWQLGGAHQARILFLQGPQKLSINHGFPDFFSVASKSHIEPALKTVPLFGMPA